MVQGVYPAYQRQLAASNAVDFDDLLLHVAALLRENPEVRASLDERYRFVLVDEYQDTNLAQYAIARALSVDYPNLAVTGDPGPVDLRLAGGQPEQHPRIREGLSRRPRRPAGAELPQHEADPARGRRADRPQRPPQGEGPVHRERAGRAGAADDLRHAEGRGAKASPPASPRKFAPAGGGPRDFAVFYRVNALSRAFEFALREHGVPYQMVNGLEFFQRKEIKDVLAYLHLLNNPRDDVAFLRVINTPTRGHRQDHARQALPTMPRGAVCRCSRRPGRPAESPRSVPGPPLCWANSCSCSTGSRPPAQGPVEEIVGQVLSETGYQQRLRESEDEEDQQRLANIEELLTVAREFDERSGGAGQLEAFLEETSLVSDTDAWEAEADRVTLMTLHASKGLEFPVVFLVAAEEGLLPHERSRERPDQLEEERRLMFVGITRAKQELQISLARYRDFRGQRKLTIPSSFLMELPRDEMELEYPHAETPVEDFWHDIDQRRGAYDEEESAYGMPPGHETTVGAAVELPPQA